MGNVMTSKESLESNQPLSPQMRQYISSGSVMLTQLEIDELRRNKKEISEFARNLFLDWIPESLKKI